MPDSPAPRLRRYAGRLVIPSIGPDDNVYDVAFRCILPHDCKTTVLWTDDKGIDHTCRKYLFLDELDKRLYNTRALVQAGEVVDVCEGQLDAATLVACGLHAVGVAGVNGWKKHHPRLFAGFPQVRVWADGDKAGREFAKKVSNDLPWCDVMMVVSDNGMDVNSTFVEHGRDAILALAEGEADDDGADDGWGLDDGDDWLHDSERPPF